MGLGFRVPQFHHFSLYGVSLIKRAKLYEKGTLSIKGLLGNLGLVSNLA